MIKRFEGVRFRAIDLKADRGSLIFRKIVWIEGASYSPDFNFFFLLNLSKVN